jgi:hypothetical protein
MDYEQKLLQDLKKNEHIIQVVEADELLAEYGFVKNTLKSYTAATLDSVTAIRLLKELGYKANQLEIARYGNGKTYVIFKGYAGNREIFKGTRYLTNNPKVVSLGVGPKGIIGSAKSGFVISFVLSVGLEVFDYVIKDDYTINKLLGTLSSDLIKIGLSAIAGAAAGLAVGASVTLGSVAALPLIAAVGVSVLVGIVLEKLDSKLGITAALISSYNNIGIKLKNIKYEINRNVNFFELNPHMIPCLFRPCSGIRRF